MKSNLNRIPDEFKIPSSLVYQINEPYSEVLDANGNQTANATTIEFPSGTSFKSIRSYMKDFISSNYKLVNDSYELTVKELGFNELL